MTAKDAEIVDNLRALSVEDGDAEDDDGDVGAAGAAATAAAAAAAGAAAAAAATSAEQHGELYLQEIEAVDDYWGPTFRAVYESDSQARFMRLLEERVASHDQEIEKMCNHHYQVL